MMKNTKCIFNGKLFGAMSVVALMAVHGAFAATGNGCDKNDRINAEIALCSTHVYNIGETENQSSESQKQLMRDTVALKTTVMTQQMYRQYEYLDATLRRFKTQLEKAVLTTKLMAAGADSGEYGGSSYSGVSTGSGSSYYRSTDSNVKLAGAQNCMTTTSFQNAYSCLASNMQLILNAVNGGNSIGEAKKQLESDLGVATTWGIIYSVNNKYSVTEKTASGLNECNSLKSTRNSIIKCAQELNVAIAKSQDDRQQKQNRQGTIPQTNF